MPQILQWHTEILIRIGQDYVHTWGPVTDYPDMGIPELYQQLRDGAYFVMDHITDSEDWARVYE